MKNQVGDKIVAKNASWSFSDGVCDNFDEHIEKSVPFYTEGHDLIAKLADFFLQNNSLCYDLGCSTGQLLKKLSERNSNKKIQFIGFDCEEEMVAKSATICKNSANIAIHTSNLMDIEFEKSDLIISYYTMQFIKPKNRQILFNRIYKSLNWGGAFILFEKVRAPDARFQDMTTALYTDYKLQQGYSGEEITAKSQSLKGILEPFSTQGNIDLIKRAGFIDFMSIMKYICFEGFLAIK